MVGEAAANVEALETLRSANAAVSPERVVPPPSRSAPVPGGWGVNEAGWSAR